MRARHSVLLGCRESKWCGIVVSVHSVLLTCSIAHSSTCTLLLQQDYETPADSKAVDLDKPQLSLGWSAAFSFAKCHLEETVPNDPFAPYAMPIEQFSRFSRLWTRG
jgi:Glycosyltransferase (GlcNAc)